VGQRSVQQKKRLQGEKETETRSNVDFLIKVMISSKERNISTKICSQISSSFISLKERDTDLRVVLSELRTACVYNSVPH